MPTAFAKYVMSVMFGAFLFAHSESLAADTPAKGTGGKVAEVQREPLTKQVTYTYMMDELNKKEAADQLFARISADTGKMPSKEFANAAKKVEQVYGELKFQHGLLNLALVLGRRAQGTGDTAAALKYYGTALNLSRALGEEHVLSPLHFNVALIHDAKGELPKALQSYLAAIDSAEKIKTKPSAASYLNAGVIYQQQKQYDSALSFYAKAVAGDDPAVAARAMGNEAQIYAEQKDYTRAIAALTTAVKTTGSPGAATSAVPKTALLINLLLLAKCYDETNQLDLAIATIDQASAEAKGVADAPKDIEAYREYLKKKKELLKQAGLQQ